MIRLSIKEWQSHSLIFADQLTKVSGRVGKVEIMAKPRIIDLVRQELAPFLIEAGYLLYHAEYVKEGKARFLRIYIEKTPDSEGARPGNPGTDDCEKVSRYLSDRLDEIDPIAEAYYLEVSSPGMDRQLISEEHFLRYQGELVDVKLYESLEGEKQLTGRLGPVTADTIELVNDAGHRINLNRDKVAMVRLTVIF